MVSTTILLNSGVYRLFGTQCIFRRVQFRVSSSFRVLPHRKETSGNSSQPVGDGDLAAEIGHAQEGDALVIRTLGVQLKLAVLVGHAQDFTGV